jgi:hypothetical protein
MSVYVDEQVNEDLEKRLAATNFLVRGGWRPFVRSGIKYGTDTVVEVFFAEHDVYPTQQGRTVLELLQRVAWAEHHSPDPRER